MIVTVIVTQL